MRPRQAHIDDTKKNPKRIHRLLTAPVSLKVKNFRLLWLSMFGSYNAMQMQMVANGWLVYDMTGSPFALGMVSAGWGIPVVLFSLFGGAVADRVLKRKLLVIVQTALFLLTLCLALLIKTGHIAIWHLVISSILMGGFLSFSMPARQAFIVDLVGKDDQLNAIALGSLASNFCRVASPALAGLLLKFIGVPGVYGIIVLSNLAVILLLLLIPRGQGAMTARPNVPLLPDVVAGLRYVRGNRIILSLLAFAFIPVLGAMPYQMLLPVFARSIFKAGETGLGLLMSSIGLGALLGSGLITSLGRFRFKGRLMFLSGTMFGLFLVLFSLMPVIPPACLCLVFIGAGSSMALTLINSLIMSNTPRELVGRVMSIFTMTYGLMPLWTLPAGILAEIVGAPATVAAGGILLTACFIGGFALRPDLRKLA